MHASGTFCPYRAVLARWEDGKPACLLTITCASACILGWIAQQRKQLATAYVATCCSRSPMCAFMSKCLLFYSYHYTLFLPRGKVRPADKLQLKAAIILPLVGLARSKQDLINRGHGAQYLYCPPPAGVTRYLRALQSAAAAALAGQLPVQPAADSRNATPRARPSVGLAAVRSGGTATSSLASSPAVSTPSTPVGPPFDSHPF